MELPRKQPILKEKDRDDLLLLTKYARAVNGDRSLPIGNITVVEGAKENVLHSIQRSVENCVVSQDKKLKKVVKDVGVLDFLKTLSTDSIEEHQFTVGYDDFGYDTILSRLLPSEDLVPSSFECIGHVVHLNLRTEQLPFRHTIGKVLLDKIESARSIVNKVDNTGGPYRTFQMELLAGEESLLTSVKENNCVFAMDYAKVYWNSKLEPEHRRIVESLRSTDILADAFAGVGPFVIPAAKKRGCRSYGNDLNPSSVEYMEKNITKNKVAPLVTTSCGDARDFLKKLVADDVPFTRVVMNFPSGAPEFLDVFRGAYRNKKNLPLPKVHCYCFAPAEDPETSAIDRVASNLCGAHTPDNFDASVRVVRNVSPKKVHVCVTFVVPESVAFAEDSSPTIKRQKLDDRSVV